MGDQWQHLSLHGLHEYRQGDPACRGRESCREHRGGGVMAVESSEAIEAARQAMGGIGVSLARKEDARFIHGQGHYVDDVVLPGMLHMVIVRSPYAHARIKGIDTSAAMAIPGVIAVVTGELLAQHKLAWMPTLSGD